MDCCLQYGSLYDTATVAASSALVMRNSGDATLQPATIMPLYHPGFRSDVSVVADSEKAVFTFRSCGGCARPLKLKVAPNSVVGSKVRWKLVGGFMDARSGQFKAGYQSVCQEDVCQDSDNHRQDYKDIILDSDRVHLLNISDPGNGVAGETDHVAGGHIEVIDPASGAVLATSKGDCDDRNRCGWSDDCVDSGDFWCVLNITVVSPCNCGSCTATSAASGATPL